MFYVLLRHCEVHTFLEKYVSSKTLDSIQKIIETIIQLYKYLTTVYDVPHCTMSSVELLYMLLCFGFEHHKSNTTSCLLSDFNALQLQRY